jgi:small-conductance mechanosensitive channel
MGRRFLLDALHSLVDAVASAPADEDQPDPWTADWFLEWLVGTPLRIATIFVTATLFRYLLVRLVMGLVARTGAVAPPRRLFGSRRAARAVASSSTIFSERRAQRAQTLGSLARSIITAVVYTVAGIMVLQELGFDVAPLIASAGIAGIALGFGAQNLVKDFISGVFMLAEDQFGVGDVIDMGEATGTVEGVSLRVTRLRDLNGAVWFVRNGEVLRVANKSQGWSRALVDVSVAPDEDLQRARSLITEIAYELAQDPEWTERIIGEPEMWGVESVTPDAVTFRITFKTKALEDPAVAREMRERAVSRFEVAGVRLPSPRSVALDEPGRAQLPPG